VAPLLPSVPVSEEPAQQSADQPHQPGKGLPWAGLGLGVLAICLIGGGSWWWMNAPQREDGQKVTALEANIAELTKQTAELKAALEASKREATAGPSPATARPSTPGAAATSMSKDEALVAATTNLRTIYASFPTDAVTSLLEQTLLASAAGDGVAIGAALDRVRSLSLPAAGDPKAAKELSARGLKLLESGEIELAAARLSEAALADTTDPQILNSLGQALARSNELSKAASASLLAFAREPRRAETWATLATTFAKTDNGASPRAVLMLQTGYRLSENSQETKALIQQLASDAPAPLDRQLAAAVLPTLTSIETYQAR